MQSQLLNSLSYFIRGKVKRLIKQGERDDAVILERVMESVAKGEVQAMVKGVDLDNSVIELRAKEIIKDELGKAVDRKVKQSNTNPKSPLNEYTKLKVALLTGRRDILDFKRDTLAQLRIEAVHHKETDGERACEVLMQEITSNKPYMEILAIAKISEDDLCREITQVLDSGQSAENVEVEAMKEVDKKTYSLFQRVKGLLGRSS